MRKFFMAGGFVLALMLGAIHMNAQTPQTGKPVTITSDMGMQVPADQPLVYEYTIDAGNLHFANPADREKYFSSLRDDVVSYRIDPKTNTVTMLLDKTYIEKNKWQASDVNAYFTKRADYMKQQYGMYEHPGVNEK